MCITANIHATLTPKKHVRAAMCKFQASCNLLLCWLLARNSPIPILCPCKCLATMKVLKVLLWKKQRNTMEQEAYLEFWELNGPQLIIQQSRIDISGKERTSLLSQCSRIHHSKCMQNKTAVFINSGIHKPQTQKWKIRRYLREIFPFILIVSLPCSVPWSRGHGNSLLPIFPPGSCIGEGLRTPWLAGSLLLPPPWPWCYSNPRHWLLH